MGCCDVSRLVPFLWVGLTAASIFGCGGERPSTPTAPACTFRATLPNGSFGPAGGAGTATVNADRGCAWTAASSVEWIAIGNVRTGTGDGSVPFAVAATDGSADRTGSIVVATQTLSISQQACVVRIVPGEQSFSDAAGFRDVNVQSEEGCRWTFEASPSWITLSPPTGSGDSVVRIQVAENDAPVVRQTVLRAGAATVSVTQSGKPARCDYALDFQREAWSALLYAPSSGGTVFMNIKTGPDCGWSASTPASWMRLSTSSGAGSIQLRVAIDRNPDTYVVDFRKTSVDFRWNSPTVGETVAVWQWGNCHTIFSPAPGTTFSAANTLAFGAGGGDALVFVLTESPFACPWIVESQAPPFTLVSPPIREVRRGDGDLHISAPPNPSSQPRTATLVVGEKALTIVQAGR